MSSRFRGKTLNIWWGNDGGVDEWVVISGQWSVVSGQWSVVSGQGDWRGVDNLLG